MPFQKGQSGNPNGRPMKHTAMADIFEAAMQGRIDDYPDTPAKRAVLKAIEKMDSGDFSAVRLIFQYGIGMPTQKQILASDPEDPFIIEVLERKR